MKNELRKMLNSIMDLIDVVAKTILPEDSSMQRFILIAYLSSWLYLPPIIYGIYTESHPQASAAEAIFAALLNTVFVAIAFTPVSIGLIFMFLLLAHGLTATLRCPEEKSNSSESSGSSTLTQNSKTE